MGTTGAELNMWQVTHGLEQSSRTAAEKQATIDLQKRIQHAVVTGTGWDTHSDAVPPAGRYPVVQELPHVRSGEDHAESRPADSDRARAARHASAAVECRPARRAREAPEDGSVEVARLPGVNHLLVAATTGEIDEYGRLTDKRVSPAVGRAMADWCTRTLPFADRHRQDLRQPYVDSPELRASAEPFTFRVPAGATKTVGRAPRADFILEAPLVSRLHCRIEAGRDNLEVIDLASTNGTFVNDKRVARARLTSGDRLRVGRVEFTVAKEPSTCRVADLRGRRSSALMQGTDWSAAPDRWSVPGHGRDGRGPHRQTQTARFESTR